MKVSFMIRKRYRSILTIGMITAMVLSGCGKKEVPMTVITPQNRIEIWAWDETFNVKAARIAAEAYQKKHPEVPIKITAKEKNEIMEDLNNNLEAKSYAGLPDIVLIEDYEVQEILSRYEGEFLEMDEYLDYSLYQDYKVELASREGKHYGVPFDSGAAVMFYRKDYLEAAGYTEKDMEHITWEEYMQIGKKVQEVTGVSMLTVQPDDLGLIRIMMQSGGSWYVKNEGEEAYISDNSILREAIHTYKKLVEQNLTVPVSGWDDFVAAFQEGKVATVVSGCWIASSIRDNQEQDGLWRVAPIPKMENIPDAVNASNIGGSSWYVIKNRNVSQLAANFLKETFGENREVIEEIARQTNLVTTRKDAKELAVYDTADSFFGNTNIFHIFLEATEKVPVVNYGMNTYEIENILETEFLDILKGEDMDRILEKVQVKAQSVVE